MSSSRSSPAALHTPHLDTLHTLRPDALLTQKLGYPPHPTSLLPSTPRTLLPSLSPYLTQAEVLLKFLYCCPPHRTPCYPPHLTQVEVILKIFSCDFIDTTTSNALATEHGLVLGDR